LRIAYLTISDPTDRRSWSGTVYRMARALEKHCGEVVNIGPLLPRFPKVGRVVNRGIRYLTGRTYLHTHTAALSRKIGRMASEKLANVNCDVIFAAAASTALAHLTTNLPIVYLSDATMRLMVDYYPEFSALLPRSLISCTQVRGQAAPQKKTTAPMGQESTWFRLERILTRLRHGRKYSSQ
jgi:hypothetical protein